ncbi:hypothetical protein K2D_28560 [Planctomycetes bacterium K2D]|uniref:Uncharacterized protein n=2 Tax=Botrimarina mediterranea TaxID=2528022 RepID=A0A518K9Y6_9BACT|nr:hypothetical protein Spa11_28100 [Botrimarina mediterranea]QDV79243.1 hypothetical protein K2D_28560 [Planctomycetes bacterium K2D]
MPVEGATTMKTKTNTAERNVTLAKTLAPEDVRPGDYVAVLSEEYEYAAFAWSCDSPLTSDDPLIRVRFRPRETTDPLRVIDACLPFVFVKEPKGKGRTLDLRAVRLARLDRAYAKRVWKALGSRAAKA